MSPRRDTAYSRMNTWRLGRGTEQLPTSSPRLGGRLMWCWLRGRKRQLCSTGSLSTRLPSLCTTRKQQLPKGRLLGSLTCAVWKTSLWVLFLVVGFCQERFVKLLRVLNRSKICAANLVKVASSSSQRNLLSNLPICSILNRASAWQLK